MPNPIAKPGKSRSLGQVSWSGGRSVQPVLAWEIRKGSPSGSVVGSSSSPNGWGANFAYDHKEEYGGFFANWFFNASVTPKSDLLKAEEDVYYLFFGIGGSYGYGGGPIAFDIFVPYPTIEEYQAAAQAAAEEIRTMTEIQKTGSEMADTIGRLRDGTAVPALVPVHDFADNNGFTDLRDKISDIIGLMDTWRTVTTNRGQTADGIANNIDASLVFCGIINKD